MGILSFFRDLFGGTPQPKPAAKSKTPTKPKPADEVAAITARTRQQIKSTTMRHATKKPVEAHEEGSNETIARPKPKKRKSTPPRKTEPAAKADTSATPAAQKPKPRKRKPKPQKPSDDKASAS